MLRAGPLCDERIIRLVNRRFVPFYFDLSNRGAAADPDARAFVVAARKELGGRAVPTPPVLLMDSQGKVLSTVSNYASADQLLAALLKALKDHPQFNQPSAAEAAQTDVLARAQILIDLVQYDAARDLLQDQTSATAHYLLGRLARFEGDFEAMEACFGHIKQDELTDDVRMERAYRPWQEANFRALLEHLKDFPQASNRHTEARYYEGLALYHLGKKQQALAAWKSLITACPQDPWIYRADWAYTTIKRGGARGVFSTAGPRHSLLGRIGYMGRVNPDLKPRSP